MHSISFWVISSLLEAEENKMTEWKLSVNSVSIKMCSRSILSSKDTLFQCTNFLQMMHMEPLGEMVPVALTVPHG